MNHPFINSHSHKSLTLAGRKEDVFLEADPDIFLAEDCKDAVFFDDLEHQLPALDSINVSSSDCSSAQCGVKDTCTTTRQQMHGLVRGTVAIHQQSEENRRTRDHRRLVKMARRVALSAHLNRKD